MTDDELYTLALEARILTGAMMKLVQVDLDRRLQPAGIGGWLQHAALRELYVQDRTISELSKRLRVEPSTLVPVVDALERDGLARRGQDPNDRRRTPLSLTQRGRQLIKTVPSVHRDDLLLNALRAMGPTKSQHYVELLRELMQRLSKDEEMVKQVSDTAQRQIARERKASRAAKS